MKTCIKCNKEKELTEFHKSKTNKNGCKNYCKECSKLINNESYLKNQEENIKAAHLYNLTEC